MLNWAVELESPIDLAAERLEPRDAAARRRDHRRRASRRGTAAARCGANSMSLSRRPASKVLTCHAEAPPPLLQTGRRRAGRTSSRGSAPRAGGAQGYWAFPELDGAGRERRHVADGSVGAAEEHRRCAEGGADAAVGAGALPRAGSAGSCRTIRRSSTASRPAGRGSSSSPTVCSSSKTASGSGFSC